MDNIEKRHTEKKLKNKEIIKIPKKYFVITVVIIAILIIGGYFYFQNTKNVAAVVNGEVITISDLDKAYESLPAQYKLVIDKESLLEQLIQAKIFYLEAQKQGLIVSEEEAVIKLEEIKNLSGTDEEEFKKDLEERGVSEKELIKDYAKQLTVQRFIEENLMNKIQISEEEIKKYYNDNIDSFKVDEQVVVSHILITDINSTKEQKNEKAKELLKEITKDNFCDYVTNYSDDPGSIQICGEYTFSKNDPFVQEFKDFSFKQKVGDIGVVDTQFGTHIIWTKEKNPAKTFSFNEVKEKILEFLKTEEARKKYKTFYEEIAKDYKIEMKFNK